MSEEIINPNSLKTTKEEYAHTEKGREANRRLKDLAKFVGPEGLEYAGSMAVHVYRKEAFDRTKLVFVIPQVITDPIHGMDQNEAVSGLTEMRNQMMLFFGLEPPRKRKDL